MTVVGLVAVLCLSGCYGPFHLTRKLHQWNGQVGDRWVNEFMFLLLAWVPVYGLTVLGDAVVFNSIEFWTGENPITSGEKHASTTRTKHIIQRDAKAILTYTTSSNGAQLLVEQFQQGQEAESVRLQQVDGITVASNAEGKTLFTAQTLPDGSMIVSDSAGTQVAYYSPDQVQRLARSTSR